MKAHLLECGDSSPLSLWRVEEAAGLRAVRKRKRRRVAALQKDGSGGPSLGILIRVVLVLLFVSGVPVQAQDQERIQTVKIVLHAAPAPRQALEYQLLPPLIDRRPGNAAVEYNRLTAERAVIFGSSEFLKRMVKWQDVPLAELRQPEVRNAFSGNVGSLLDDLDKAARCEFCDWQILNRVREQGYYQALLPEFQQCRDYARILLPWIRMKVAEGKFDEAVRGLQTGYALARDLANAPYVVCGLVGCGVADMMSFDVVEFIQQPGVPNLYWALSQLPRPIVDLRACYQGEMDALYLSHPELRDLDKKNYPREYWQYLFHRSQDEYFRLVEFFVKDKPRKFSPAEREIVAAAYLLNAYPKAKRFLIERGKPAAEIEAMPATQVILVAAMRNYDEIRESHFKRLFLPYAESPQGIHQTGREYWEATANGGEILPLGWLLTGGWPAKMAEMRAERGIAFLRMIEALRLYAAGHGGRLPENLKDITEVPVPIDPYRGEPFLYHREGRAGVLEAYGAPFGPVQYWNGVRMEITIAEEGK